VRSSDAKRLASETSSILYLESDVNSWNVHSSVFHLENLLCNCVCVSEHQSPDFEILPFIAILLYRILR
jgi:hypothetical protein